MYILSSISMSRSRFLVNRVDAVRWSGAFSRGKAICDKFVHLDGRDK